MGAELADALAAELAIARRGATDVRRIEGGWALRHDGLPSVWYLNRVQLTGPAGDLDAEEVSALADRHLAGRAHRRIVVDDVSARGLGDGLCERGFVRTRTLWMALRSDLSGAIADPRARRLDESELVELQRATHAELAGDERRAAPLLDGQAALRAGTPALGFGAGQMGELASTATLFACPAVGGRRVAIIDEVVTLRRYREQGLARAVVSAAVRAAGAWGAQLVALATDAEDWPQLMYASLGFAPLGEQLTFDRRAPHAPAGGRAEAPPRTGAGSG